MGRFNGKVALVTGAASGIGAAIVARLLEEGASVASTDLTAPESAPDSAPMPLSLDVTREADWIAAIDAILARHGQIDVLVNNAGISATQPQPIRDTSLEDWRRVNAVNLDGVFLGMKHAMRAMQGKGGSIVNIASMLSFIAIPDSAAYCASKGGVLQLTRAGALEGAAMTPQIRVNSIHPGYVETPLLSKRLAQRPGLRETLTAQTPLRRLARPEEVASVCCYLASDEAGYATGAALTIDGGFTIR